MKQLCEWPRGVQLSRQAARRYNARFAGDNGAVAAALRMRAAMRDLDSDLVLKIGIHEGPCLAVMVNEHQDYFGQTVNIASRVQGLATSTSIFATGRVVGHSGCARLFETNGIKPSPKEHSLRGVAAKMAVFEIT